MNKSLSASLAIFSLALMFGIASENVAAQSVADELRIIASSDQENDTRTSGKEKAKAASHSQQGSLLGFFPKVYILTQLPFPRSELQIHCQMNMKKAYVSFIGIKEGGIFLVALTDNRFNNPGSNLFTSRPREGLRPGGTLNWAYIFDRNHDGKVDYLAFLDGPLPVVPEDWKGDLPNLTRPITGKEFKEIVIPNLKLLFWHMADDNYDGYPDGIAVSLQNLESGWFDGWMLARDLDFDGHYDFCKSYQGRLHSELGDCEGTSTDYHVPNKELSGLIKVPSGQDIFLFINEAAEKCQLTGESFHRRMH